MKSLKLISFLLIIFFHFGCKKDKIDSKSSNTSAEFYLNESDNKDGLLIEFKSTDGNVYYYGKSNSEGKIDSIKSIAYKKNDNADTIINFILDEYKKPYIIYLSNAKNNNKYNNITKITYINNDSIKLSLYRYDWTNAQDSLMAEYVTNGTIIEQTYGNARIADELEDQLRIIGNDIIKSFMGVGAQVVVAAFTAGIFVAAGFVGVPVAIATIITTGVFMIDFANANTQIKYTTTTNPNAPTSPTAVNATIPNPVGTPENPTGENDNSGMAILTKNGLFHNNLIITDVSIYKDLADAPNYVYVDKVDMKFFIKYSDNSLSSFSGLKYAIIGKGGSLNKDRLYLYYEPYFYTYTSFSCGAEKYNSTYSISGRTVTISWKTYSTGSCLQADWQITGTWK